MLRPCTCPWRCCWVLLSCSNVDHGGGSSSKSYDACLCPYARKMLFQCVSKYSYAQFEFRLLVLIYVGHHTLDQFRLVSPTRWWDSSLQHCQSKFLHPQTQDSFEEHSVVYCVAYRLKILDQKGLVGPYSRFRTMAWDLQHLYKLLDTMLVKRMLT